ncbi:MAG: hypothetical protein K2Y39_22765 [Candidatus Obscuribacterales bacterium]|nr:hypothetical protein [Candidatus Obscuribacterales bacterium]
MDQKQARKNVRGVRNALDFVLLQLHYAALHFGEAQGVKAVNGLTDEGFRIELHSLRDSCDAFMQEDPHALARIGQSVAALALAREVLQKEMIWERDDGESMRYMQFTVLCDALRVLQERVMTALNT